MGRRYLVLGLWFAFMAGFPVVKGQDNSTSVRVTDRNNDTSTRVLGQDNDTSRVPGQDDNKSTDDDPLPCGSPPPLEHGSFTLHNKGMHVIYRCTTPHILYGSNYRRCKPNGQWGGTTPICSGYRCPDSQAPLVPNASVNRFNGGTVRVYECHEEYRSEGPGNPTVYCNGTHWLNQPPRCVLKEVVASLDTCSPPPIVEKAAMITNPDGFVKYTCVRGYYKRLGTKSIRCGPGGQWIGTPGVCTRSGCVVLDIINGIVSMNGIRTVAKIKCHDGYQLKGSPLLFCNGHNWNGSLPICEAQRQNGGYPAVVRDGRSCAYRIPTIQNGRYDYADKSDSNGQLFYAVVYSCNTGYVMHPANHVVYCSSGNVVGTPPNCISTCGHSKGGCWHNCRNVEGEGAVCSCRDGYQLGSDGKSCHDINECSANQGRGPCQNACANSYGSFSCYCLTGYTLADDGTSCLRNRGTCDCGPNGRCIRRTGYESECQCFNGYRRSDDRLHCLDIDECVESGDGRADCQGACRNTPGSYRCFCPESWQQLGRNGRTCEERPCSCGHESIACSQPNGRRICTCSEGYKPTPDGTRCVDHNECEETDPCQGECINTQGSYHCRCRESGYQLAADRHSCEDINECRNSQLNNCQHACVNEPGSFHCDCPPGHILMPDGISCKECRANSYRSSIANECVECPAHSHTIGNLKASIGDCVCLPGFSGALLRDQPCKDIDECERDNGGCKQHCINTPGSFYCACPDGYSLLDDGKTCTDRDECAQSNGGCQHNCVNTEGSFSCSCNEGYAVDPTDPYSCIDVNECETPDHGCEQFCVNFHGGFYCQCDDNSIRAPDGKTCKAITCSPLEIPEKMKLSPRERCIGMRGANQITVGTTCRMSCQRGYELVGESNRTCLNTGRWSGEMPACRFVRCAALEPPEHGQVRPASCLLDNEVQFKRACAFTCDQGYSLIGPAFRNCQANGTWSNEKPRCEEISEITCPRDITTVLQLGASSAVIDLPRPVHTLARLESSVPLAGHAFPAGRTAVTYTAQSNTTDSAVSCSFHVIVEDKESPVFTFCPESFTVHTDEQYPSITWEAPLATDNVAVVENTTWISPESRFTWGTYTVLTDVRDAAGNSASCKFSISIRTIDCGEPIGPVNGDSGCSDWMFGRICEPTCNQLHYFFDGPPNDLYLCGFNGEWSPSSEVPDCSPYSALGDESMCLLGTVLKTFPAIEGPVCIACPRGTFWAVVMENEASCLPCNQETYQDEFGMDSCKRCPSGHVTEAEGAKTSNQCKPVEDLQTIYNGVGGANRSGSD